MIKEENYHLFGVVEEKALKADTPVITFDFWTIRSHVLYDRDTNAAVVLQKVWRDAAERRRTSEARAKANARRFSHAANSALTGVRMSAASGAPSERATGSVRIGSPQYGRGGTNWDEATQAGMPPVGLMGMPA